MQVSVATGVTDRKGAMRYATVTPIVYNDCPDHGEEIVQQMAPRTVDLNNVDEAAALLGAMDMLSLAVTETSPFSVRFVVRDEGNDLVPVATLRATAERTIDRAFADEYGIDLGDL